MKVLADIEHVFKYYKRGLIDNTRFLYRMLMDLKARKLEGDHRRDVIRRWVRRMPTESLRKT